MFNMDTTLKSLKLLPEVKQFLADTLTGLKTKPKFMHSKYFYDKQGDYIFQQIMSMDEYYLTDAEMDIISGQSQEIAEVIAGKASPFDLIELGAGDATKSIHLLKQLIARNLEFSYLPVDISANVISQLENDLPAKLPALNIKGFNGDYLDMLGKAASASDRRKVVLFMGANIGNMDADGALEFCRKLKRLLAKGDMLIIGFDLKKDPNQILAAYDDALGITRDFNLNLLKRINRELGGDFNLDNFGHYATYDPESGACKSFLISLKDQHVHIGDTETIHFSKNEHIFMEISQKYSLEETDVLAMRSGFHCRKHFFDKNKYFVDAVWLVD